MAKGKNIMASSLNKVCIIGNLGNDPDIKTMNNGGKVCNLSVATSEIWKDKNTGERREKTEWHRVSIFNEGLVGVCEKYLKKGSKVYLEGALETRKWQDQSGADRYSTEIVLKAYNGSLIMLGGKSTDTSEPTAHDTAKQNAYQPQDDEEDDLPF